MEKNNYFPEDEEIWSDLKYWLENPITYEEEKKQQEAEKAYYDYLLEKAFSGD